MAVAHSSVANSDALFLDDKLRQVLVKLEFHETLRLVWELCARERDRLRADNGRDRFRVNAFVPSCVALPVASYGLHALALNPPGSSTTMPVTLEVLQAQILSLSKADRSRLLDCLVASLEVDVEAEAEWEQLADERDADLESETVNPLSLEEAMTRLRARFPG